MNNMRRYIMFCRIFTLLVSFGHAAEAQSKQEDDELPKPRNVTVFPQVDSVEVKWTVPDNVDDMYEIRGYSVKVMSPASRDELTFWTYATVMKDYGTTIKCLRPNTVFKVSVMSKYKFKANSTNAGTGETDEVTVVTLPETHEDLISFGLKNGLPFGIGACFGAVILLLLEGAIWCLCRGIKRCRRRGKLNVDGGRFDPPSARELRNRELRRSDNAHPMDTSVGFPHRSTPQAATKAANTYCSPQRVPLIQDSKPNCFYTRSPSVPYEPAPARPPNPPSCCRKNVSYSDEQDADSDLDDQDVYQNTTSPDHEPPIYGNL